MSKNVTSSKNAQPPKTKGKRSVVAPSVTCCVPLPGMTVQPLYYPSEDWDIFHGGAWIVLMQFLMGKDEARAAFKEDTGHDLERLSNRAPIVAMIDKTTGFESSVMAAWCDWVTLNHWGVSGEKVTLEDLKREFDEALAGMSDEEIIAKFEDMGCTVTLTHNTKDHTPEGLCASDCSEK